jgi:hypothetical protein
MVTVIRSGTSAGSDDFLTYSVDTAELSSSATYTWVPFVDLLNFIAMFIV